MYTTHPIIDDDCNPEEDRYFDSIDEDEDEKMEERSKALEDPLKDQETPDHLILADDGEIEEDVGDDVIGDDTDATEEKMFEQVESDEDNE